MNTTYFLNCAAGNIFNTKTSPALPKTYYIGLSTSAAFRDRHWKFQNRVKGMMWLGRVVQKI